MGRGLARIYAGRGDDIVLLARDTKGHLQEAVDSCREVAPDPGQTIAAEFLDITAFDSLQSNMDRLMAQFGVPDLLILCAGVATNSTFLDTPREKFDWVMEVNLAGSRETARAVLPSMMARGSGQIAFFSSMAGMLGIYGYSAYSASKFAVNGLVQALRQELLGTGVRVNLVCPPEVATPMIAAEAASVLPQTRFLKDLGGTLQTEVAVQRIARGIDRNKALIIPGARARLMGWIARHFPWLFGKSSELLLRWKF
jgi:3-dehydrosphinganine reductase